MDGVEELKLDVKEGRIDVDRLVDLIVILQGQLREANQQSQSAQEQLQDTQQKLKETLQRLGELEEKLGMTKAKVDEPFSVGSEEKRQEKRGRRKQKRKGKNRRGRISSSEKIALASRRETVYPEGVDQSQCVLSHVRPVWRLEGGKAILVAYEVYRDSKKQYGQIPGVLGRSEFGIEIVTEIAYLVHVIGLSFDKVGRLLKFFQNLNVPKSQIDALLNRLAKHWEDEFEALCTLVANSLVVHTDETRWSLNSVWAFLSEKARVILFGVHKDAATLKFILDPETFAGLVFSDNAAVYANFSASQKCWAHLLRKAIKLTLQDPLNAKYRSFTDRFLDIYREASRVRDDQRLGDAGREKKVAELQKQIYILCAPNWPAKPPSGLEGDFCRLINEVVRLTIDEQLFTFVVAKPAIQPNGQEKPVDGTNNEAERVLRNPAQARVTGRTNKTMKGARRQTILTSVLESLRLYLETYTLESVLQEMQRWWTAGESCFTKLLRKLKLKLPDEPVINRTHPQPSG